MSDVLAAIEYVLDWEDATRSGVVTTKKSTGKRTRFGIDETFHSELTATPFYTTMTREEALTLAEVVYKNQYATALCIAEITDQDVANKLLSLGVNVGIKPAAKMLQDTLRVAGDGRIGPITLAHLDWADPKQVLEELREEAETYYRRLVVLHPEDAPNLKGWLRRAAA